MMVFKSARWNSAAVLGLAAALCGNASGGSVLVPNAGVEVYRNWAALAQGFVTNDEVGSTALIRSGAAVNWSYGLKGTVLVGLDASVTEITAGKDVHTA